MFFLRRKSRTITLPRFTCVSVPSQRSVTSQIVPRTVAELFRPLVRNRPRAFARSRLIRRRLNDAVAPFPRPALPHREKLDPFRIRSVRP